MLSFLMHSHIYVNQAVSCRLVKEVHGLNPSFDAADIRSKYIVSARKKGMYPGAELTQPSCICFLTTGAAYTYYKTLCQEKSLQRRGVCGEHKKQRRRRERIARVSIIVQNS